MKFSSIEKFPKYFTVITERKQQIPLSMVKKYVELMHECRPQHCMPHADTKKYEIKKQQDEEGKRRRENMNKVYRVLNQEGLTKSLGLCILGAVYSRTQWKNYLTF